MTKARKFLALALAAAMTVSLAGCGGGEKETEAPATEKKTEAVTEKVTEAPTEAPTEAVTEAPTEAETEAVTEAPTEAVTEAVTEAETEAVTEAPTEAETEAVTEAPTEAETEAVTEAPEIESEMPTALTVAETEAETEEVTEAPTEAETEEVTEAPTEAETEAVTEAPTEAETEEVTEVPTEAETEEVTEAPTEAETEEVTEVPTEAETEEVTEAPTEAETEEVTEAPTEAETEEVTEAPTEAETEEVTEAETEAVTEAPETELTTAEIVVAEAESELVALVDEAESEVAAVITAAETEAETEEVTEAPTEAETEEVTEAPTEAETEEVTEAPTEAETEEVTETPTEAAETEAPAEAETELESENVTAAEIAVAEEETEGETGAAMEELSGEELDEYDVKSAEVYEAAFGEFYETYLEALEAENISERYALMAVAEAKMLESAVMIPLSSNGGMYSISKVAPYTNTPILWGNDSYRYYRRLVTTELIKTEDRDEMKAKWAELKGTGTYEEWARSFLEEKGYEIKDTYDMAYNSDPVTWDVLATSLAADSEAIINTYDGLMEYDVENVLQPTLAESYEVSDDGLTYTFHIREGVKWVDSQGREVADVKADDWVAGMQHMMDAMGGLEYLVTTDGCGIKNASAYIYGETSDFNEVGVKAVDDYTLEYTLEAPCPFFTTMLGYGVFAPMSRSYYESQGGKFGAEYDSSAADYNYGKDPNSIAYCGPYVVTNATAQNTIVFQANESYWNKDAVNVKTLTWLFDSGDDAMKGYNDTMSGVLDGCTLTPARLEQAKADGVFDEYNYISSTDATSFMGFYNLNRNAFANFNDDTVMVSEQSEEDAARTNVAINNVHFRRAVSFALDRGAYNAQVVGEDLKLTSLRNSYIPGTFVTLPEDVTIDINGTATDFAAGTNYGVIVQAQIDADDVKMTVYDPEGDGGVGSSDGFDGWYNPENAVAELETAVEELAAEGVEISPENPIYLDLPYPANSEPYTNKENAFKQSVEQTLGGSVIINLVAGNSFDDWYYAGYYPTYGYESNYDICDVSGWGPDYGDPQTFLNTLLPEYAGYMIKALGIY